MEKSDIHVHVHVFDGPEESYEFPYLGGSIMSSFSCKTCSICGLLEDEHKRSNDSNEIVIA